MRPTCDDRPAAGVGRRCAAWGLRERAESILREIDRATPREPGAGRRVEPRSQRCAACVFSTAINRSCDRRTLSIQ